MTSASWSAVAEGQYERIVCYFIATKYVDYEVHVLRGAVPRRTVSGMQAAVITGQCESSNLHATPREAGSPLRNVPPALGPGAEPQPSVSVSTLNVPIQRDVQGPRLRALQAPLEGVAPVGIRRRIEHDFCPYRGSAEGYCPPALTDA